MEKSFHPKIYSMHLTCREIVIDERSLTLTYGSEECKNINFVSQMFHVHVKSIHPKTTDKLVK